MLLKDLDNTAAAPLSRVILQRNIFRFTLLTHPGMNMLDQR